MYLSMASLYRTASLREPVTTMALALPSSRRRDVGAEVLDDDLDLLADVVRVQLHPVHQRLQRLGLLDLGVVRVVVPALVGELEGQLVAGVVLQHVEDEALLDGLLHRVEVERLRQPVRALAAEQLQRLGLGRGGEGEVA